MHSAHLVLSFPYLWLHSQDFVHYMNRMYSAEPKVCIAIECYHYELKSRDSTDSEGHSTTETYYERVVTYTEKETVRIASWEDASLPIDYEPLKEYAVINVKLTATFKGDTNYITQCKAMIDRNRHRDTFIYGSRTLDLQGGFKRRVLAYVDLDKKPLFLSMFWYSLAHWTFFLSLPYRIWMSSKSGKLTTTIRKILTTDGPGNDLPTDSIGGATDDDSNEGSLMEELYGERILDDMDKIELTQC